MQKTFHCSSIMAYVAGVDFCICTDQYQIAQYIPDIRLNYFTLTVEYK